MSQNLSTSGVHHHAAIYRSSFRAKLLVLIVATVIAVTMRIVPQRPDRHANARSRRRRSYISNPTTSARLLKAVTDSKAFQRRGGVKTRPFRA